MVNDLPPLMIIGVLFQQRQQIFKLPCWLREAHLFQPNHELVDLDDVVIYPGCPVLFKQVQVTSGRSCGGKRRGVSVTFKAVEEP